MKNSVAFLVFLPIFSLSFFFFSCNRQKLEPITIISEPEHKTLEPFIEKFEKVYKTEVEMHYNGAVDIMAGLQRGTLNCDAVWPAGSLWITLGDIGSTVKHTKSVMASPVVFGIKQNLAKDLGWIDSEVSVKDIVEAVKSNEFSFLMTSAAQSSSGASAYTGFLYALSGNPDILTLEHLHSEDLKRDIRNLLSGVHRTSGSSVWLKELYLKSDYDAMVNYEALIIEANRELVARGKEPLYVVYPVDGIVIADSPLGYIDRNNGAKEETFLKLQEFLLSKEIQDEITQIGRKTNSEQILTPITIPSAEVISEALYLYQTVFRKPSLTIFCLDYSGSMRESGGIYDLKKAMRMLLDQEKAREYLIQTGKDDITMILPFRLTIFDMYTVKGNDQQELDKLYQKIDTLQPKGATDIYTPIIMSLDILSGIETLSNHMPAIILITDGESNRGRTFSHLQRAWETYNIDIPVFPIMFGEADEYQLEQISALTKGRVFNGKHDLVATFRKAKGYN